MFLFPQGEDSKPGASAVTATTSKSKKLFSFSLGKDKEPKKKNSAPSAKIMAKGVGYSSYLQKGWDVKSYLAAQKEKDKQIELVLAKIYRYVKGIQKEI